MREIKILYSKQEIEKRIEAIAAELNELYKNEDEVTAICVLKGACVFFSDLVRKLKMPLKFEFVKLSSYGDDTKSKRSFQETSLNISDLTGKNVILVEDIVDSGFTLSFLNKYFNEKYKMKSYRTVALLNKPASRTPDLMIDADFYGFETDDKFVIGYGLDYQEKYRELDFVGYFC